MFVTARDQNSTPIFVFNGLTQMAVGSREIIFKRHHWRQSTLFFRCDGNLEVNSGRKTMEG